MRRWWRFILRVTLTTRRLLGIAVSRLVGLLFHLSGANPRSNSAIFRSCSFTRGCSFRYLTRISANVLFAFSSFVAASEACSSFFGANPRSNLAILRSCSFTRGCSFRYLDRISANVLFAFSSCVAASEACFSFLGAGGRESSAAADTAADPRTEMTIQSAGVALPGAAGGAFCR